MTKVRKKIGTIPINDIEQQVQQSTSTAITQMQQDVTDFINEETAQYPEIGGAFKFQEDPEGRSEITTDAEDKVISYRDSDGVKHENVGIKCKNIIVDYLSNPTDKEYVYLERPKFGELRFYGTLPTDNTDARTPTNLSFIFKVADEIKLVANCTLAIQGHGTALVPKKGYTFEPFNSQGDALEIKFGNMTAADSFHLKGFQTDQTHTRDVCGYKVWERLIKSLDYPYSKINNIPFEFKNTFKKNIDAIEDAQYHPDGFPCVVYHNDDFLGLYTLRLKKSRQNYAMEKSVKSQIFLDNANTYYIDEHGQSQSSSWLNRPFDYRGWELKNPKIKNYEDCGPITDAAVLSSIERLFNFMSDFDNQWENYADFIVLPHWLVFVITEELLNSTDCIHNNTNLLTWDNTHWTIAPYDLDMTLGISHRTEDLVNPSNANETMLYTDLYPKFKEVFDTEIKELYTKLRKSGIISCESIMQIYREQINNVPRSVFEDDLKKWGTIWASGYTTIEHINAFLAARIEYLDTIWLNNN